MKPRFRLETISITGQLIPHVETVFVRRTDAIEWCKALYTKHRVNPLVHTVRVFDMRFNKVIYEAHSKL